MRLYIMRLFAWVPDVWMLSLQYWIQLGRKLNWSTPTRFTEKLQLYKRFYRNPDLWRCVDKYAVRSYVEQKGCGALLNTLYGVYDQVEEIDVAQLPNRFVLKVTNGGGGNNVILCPDKTKMDWTKVMHTVRQWMKCTPINAGREWAYDGIGQSRIVVEEFLENPKNPAAGIEDYKFFCFHGEPLYLVVDVDRYTDHRRNFYTVDWQRLDISSDCEQCDREILQPPCYEQMLVAARALSADFPFVRVDLYNIEGRIVFGELTFYPWSGYVQFKPDAFDEVLGACFKSGYFKEQ